LNILHRDIKAENILLDDKGNSYLSDFGLALKLKKEQKIQEFVGTLEYLSPQIVNLESYDQSADWWSFGCIIYEMLVGKSPFYDRDNKP
jgi:serine/threonine protein kinase